jgi:hypothetical protein
MSKKFNDTKINDPYSNVNKADHILSFRSEIPKYQGHQPSDVNNFNVKRPYCLSTKKY